MRHGIKRAIIGSKGGDRVMIADLHIHSRYSRATSRDGDLEHLDLWARKKGIGLVVAGHWGTEHAIADVLAALIARQFPGLTVAHAEADTDPYCYLA